MENPEFQAKLKEFELCISNVQQFREMRLKILFFCITAIGVIIGWFISNIAKELSNLEPTHQIFIVICALAPYAILIPSVSLTWYLCWRIKRVQAYVAIFIEEEVKGLNLATSAINFSLHYKLHQQNIEDKKERKLSRFDKIHRKFTNKINKPTSYYNNENPSTRKYIISFYRILNYGMGIYALFIAFLFGSIQQTKLEFDLVNGIIPFDTAVISISSVVAFWKLEKWIHKFKVFDDPIFTAELLKLYRRAKNSH